MYKTQLCLLYLFHYRQLIYYSYYHRTSNRRQLLSFVQQLMIEAHSQHVQLIYYSQEHDQDSYKYHERIYLDTDLRKNRQSQYPTYHILFQVSWFEFSFRIQYLILQFLVMSCFKSSRVKFTIKSLRLYVLKCEGNRKAY